MFCRNVTSLISIFVAVVTASIHNASQSTTESNPEVSVYHLTTENPEDSTADQYQEVDVGAVVGLPALLDAGEDAIVTLVAGDTRLAAHRAVLAARSPVLGAMLDGVQVEIPDVGGPVLRHLLGYLYTLQAPHLPGMAPQLLAAADRFGLPALKDECGRQLTAGMTVENAATALALGVRHSCELLREAAFTFVEAHLATVMTTRAWAEVVSEVSWLFPELSTATSAPAPGDGRATPTSEPHGDHSGQTAAPAGQTTAARLTTKSGDAAVSLLHAPAPGDGRTSPTSEPHGGHSGQTAASAGQTTAARLTTKSGDAAVSPLHIRVPAASSAASPTTHPLSDHSVHSGQTPASDAPPTTTLHIPTPDYAALSTLSAPVPGDGRTTPTSEPHSDHKGQTAASAGQTMAARHTNPNDDAAVSPLHIRVPAAGSAAAPATQLLSGHSVHSGRTSASAAPPTTTLPAPTPDYAAFFRLQSLSPAQEKALRLIYAAKDGTEEDVVALLAAGADVGAVDEHMRTPLHWAARGGHVGTARLLLAAGAAVDARTGLWGDWTPLHLAAQWGHAAAVRLLVGAGADPNAGAWDGKTPLHLAAMYGQAEAAKALLEAGANVGAMDRYGQTPQDVAREYDPQRLANIPE